MVRRRGLVAEGDIATVHGRYSGVTPKPTVAVDVFRFGDGVAVEHWDVIQEMVPASRKVSGNAMFELADSASAELPVDHLARISPDFDVHRIQLCHR